MPNKDEGKRFAYRPFHTLFLLALAGFLASSCFMKGVYFVPDFLDSVEAGDELDGSLAYVYGRFQVGSREISSDLSLQLNDNQSSSEKVYIKFSEDDENVFAVGIKPGVYRIPYLLLSMSSMTGMLSDGEYSRIWVREECFSGWFEVRPGDLVYIGDFYGVLQGGYNSGRGALQGFDYNFDWTTNELMRSNPDLQTMSPRRAWDEQGMRACLARKSGAMPPPPPPVTDQSGYLQVPNTPVTEPSASPSSNYQRVEPPPEYPPQPTTPIPSNQPPPPPPPPPAPE